MITFNCQLCLSENFSQKQFSRHLTVKHPQYSSKEYFETYLMTKEDLKYKYCIYCNKERPFRGITKGYSKDRVSLYCNSCRIQYGKETHKKISDKVKENWKNNVYEGNAAKLKIWRSKLTPEQIRNYTYSMMNSMKNYRFKTGVIGSYTYRSSFEKEFIELVNKNSCYKIITQNHLINYKFKGEDHYYFLDFVLENIGTNKIIFVEIKGNTPFYRKEIDSGKAEFKYGAAHRICQENNFDFWFLTSKKIIKEYLRIK